MLLASVLRIAWRNLRKNWRHSTAALCSIVVGFCAIGIFEGYLRNLMDVQVQMFGKRGMYGDLLVEKRNASSPEGREDPFKYAMGTREQRFLDDFLRAHASLVRERVRFLNTAGMVSRGATNAVFIGVGYDVPEGTRLRGDWAWDVAAGVPLQLGGPESVILAKGLAAALDCAPEGIPRVNGPGGIPLPEKRPFSCDGARLQLSVTTESGQVNALEPSVAGIVDLVIKEMDERILLMPLPELQKLVDSTAVSLYSIALVPGTDARAFTASLAAEARRAGLELDVTTWWNHPVADLLRKGMDLLGIYRSFVAVVVVTIAGMSVLTMMMRSVSERTREVGTLRSLGFLRRHVIAIFAAEAAMLAVAAAAIGMLITVSVALTINALEISYRAGVLSAPIPFTIALTPAAYVFAAVFLATMAAGAAALAARRAVRLAIPAALGHV